MEQRHQDILRQMRQNIIDDLDVNNGIIVPLTTEFVLRPEDVVDINKGRTKPERANILLDLLPQRGSHAFEAFHQSLKHQYDWLSEEIDKMLATPGTIDNDGLMANPNLQPVSPLTVTRVDMNGKLKDALQALEPNGYIALHGMKGFGKSCLAASTLKDKDLAQRLFNNEIYWIKFGDKRGLQEEILIQLNNLYHLIKSLNPLQESLKTDSLEKTLKQNIEYHFRKGSHRNALLILDDVCHKEIIDKFDFTCKTLVITSDIGVLNKRSHSVVAMDHGFTELETLGLFAKVLDTSVEHLPPQAKLIHEECKGMPLLIAMFAAQFENFKHDMKHHIGRWEYYLNSLRTKNAKNKVIEEFMKIQEATFDMCINQLQDEMRERYEHLAIFSEDVNIMPKTLEILWYEEPYSVDEQMLDFCHKSLAAKKWNDDLRSYIYGVHDLLLCHLRKKLSPEEMRDKHRLFIEKYRKYCNGDFSKLPDDNYSFSYIGYHLEQAELFDDFHELYTNFDFLQAKINNTGLSDLLIDLKKYRKYITKNGNQAIESNLSDMEIFLESHASTLAKHRHMKCLDLVQIALDHSDDGFIKNMTNNLALSRPNSLYFSHNRTSLLNNNCYTNFCQEIPANASTVVFTEEPNHVLVGTNDGDIILWDTDNRKPKIFSGHNKRYAIKKIVLSMPGDYFLALSEDGTLKIFVLNESEFTRNGLSIPVQSPRHKQIFWKNFFQTSHDDSVRTFAIKHEHITDMKFSLSNKKVAACTNAGTIAVWNAETGVLEWQDKLVKPHRFGGVSFSTEDNLLHVLDETISVVRIYKKNQDGYSYVSQFNLQLTNPRGIYFSKHPKEENFLVIVTDKVALYFKWFVKDEHIHSYERQVKIEEREKNVYYTAATLTYDARYLIIGNSKGIISVVKAYNTDDLITYIKGNVTSLDSYWMQDEKYHMVCGGEQRWIYNWKIGDDEQPKPVKELLFDARVQNFGSSIEDNIVVLKTAPSEITTCNGKVSTKSIKSQHGKISSIELHDNATKLIYMTESGSIVIYDMVTQEETRLTKLVADESYIDILQIEDYYAVLCRNQNKLQIYRNVKSSTSIENVSDVIFVHKINRNCVMTVSKQGQIKYWYIEDFEWLPCGFSDGSGTIVYSSISSSKTLLAILNEEQNLIIYKLPNMETRGAEGFKIDLLMKQEYKSQLSICQFSHDGRYLAVALDNGEISIIDLHTQQELGKLCLHCSPVSQLHWSPLSISVPILLSVNCDELVWWNVSMLRSIDKNQNRRSRMGLSRSISSQNVDASPRSSFSQMSISESPETPNPQVIVDKFWSRKLAKSNRPAMLGCVQLPSTCTGEIKVCVSEDFSKFLTVDIHGTVNNFTIFGNFDM